MKQADYAELSEVLGGVYDLYGKQYDPRVVDIWFAALNQYEVKDIRIALTRHIQNPDSGQFMPKPADVVRMLHGGTGVQGMAAWTMVDQSIRRVGPYMSVVFDDPIVHRVIEDMGGWIKMAGLPTEEDMKFAGIEFSKRYQGYLLRGGVGNDYPYRLIGLSEGHNAKGGYVVEPPLLIGNAEKAALVSHGGRGGNSLQITSGAQLGALLGNVTKAIENQKSK